MSTDYKNMKEIGLTRENYTLPMHVHQGSHNAFHLIKRAKHNMYSTTQTGIWWHLKDLLFCTQKELCNKRRKCLMQFSIRSTSVAHFYSSNTHLIVLWQCVMRVVRVKPYIGWGQSAVSVLKPHTSFFPHLSFSLIEQKQLNEN